MTNDAIAASALPSHLVHPPAPRRASKATASRPAGVGAAEIRSALVARLAAGARGPALVLHELRVGSGAFARIDLDATMFMDSVGAAASVYVAQSSADVALLTPDALDLYEIKGARDSLVRLKTQIPAYDDTGSTNTLVVDAHHLDRALEVLPPWWGVIVAVEDPVRLEDVRPASANPACTRRGLLEPLSPRELRPFAFAFGARRDSSKGKSLDFLDAVAADCDVAGRWLRYQLAQRDHESAYNVAGRVIGRRALPARVIGDLALWPPMVFARSLFPGWECRAGVSPARPDAGAVQTRLDVPADLHPGEAP